MENGPSSSKRMRGLRWLGIPTVILLWEAIARLFVDQTAGESSFLPTLVDVVKRDLPAFAIFDFSSRGFEGGASYVSAIKILAINSLSTIRLVFVGVGIGAVIGIGGGLILARWKTLRSAIEPIILVLRTIPLLALIPLFLLWFGAALSGHITYIAFAVSAMLIINTLEAVRNVPPVYLSFSRTFGASENHVYRTVIFPAIIPELVGGLRVVLGLAWAIALGAEFLASQSGLGRLLLLSQNFLFTGRMLVIVILFGIFAAITNSLALYVGRRATRWMP